MFIIIRNFNQILNNHPTCFIVFADTGYKRRNGRIFSGFTEERHPLLQKKKKLSEKDRLFESRISQMLEVYRCKFL